MKKSALGAAIILLVGFTTCTSRSDSDSQANKVDTTAIQMKNNMKNLISIVEIPATEFPRATAFYQAILDIKIEEFEMEGIKMGLFPNDGQGIAVQIIQGSGYKPSVDGTIAYLNCGTDLQVVANKIEANGGKIVLPKTAIGPDMGFYAMFIDTEGNKLGLYSQN